MMEVKKLRETLEKLGFRFSEMRGKGCCMKYYGDDLRIMGMVLHEDRVNMQISQSFDFGKTGLTVWSNLLYRNNDESFDLLQMLQDFREYAFEADKVAAQYRPQFDMFTIVDMLFHKLLNMQNKEKETNGEE